MHGLAVYVKEGLPFSRDVSLENSADCHLFPTGFTSLSVLLLFPLSITFIVFVHVFDFISSNIDEVLSINPSANVFVFGNVHHKDWFTYSGGTNRSGELCYNFSLSNDLTQMANVPTRIPGCDSHSPAILELFLLTLVFVLQWLSLLNWIGALTLSLLLKLPPRKLEP